MSDPQKPSEIVAEFSKTLSKMQVGLMRKRAEAAEADLARLHAARDECERQLQGWVAEVNRLISERDRLHAVIRNEIEVLEAGIELGPWRRERMADDLRAALPAEARALPEGMEA